MEPAIVIFGATGFLGRYLCRHFARQGREVVAVARNRSGWSGDGMFLPWDGQNTGPWAEALEGAAAVINLCGRSVNCRYTPAMRRELTDSRLVPTRTIGRAIAACRVPPKVWLNASTATWYRHAEDRPQDDWLGEPGTGFSCELARDWEEGFFAAAVPAATRKVALRIGMVIANEPGTVHHVLSRLACCGLGGAMGNGRQRVSWIHMGDFLRAVAWIMADPFLDGAINLTAPSHPTNRDLMAQFRVTVGMPLGLPAARWMVAAGARMLGTEPELVLKSRWAMPVRLRDSGFQWCWPELSEALADLSGRKGLVGFFRAAEVRSLGAGGWVPARTH